MKVLNGAFSGIGLLLATMTFQSCSSTQTGPKGGDVVTLNSGAKAEIVANTDTGEVMVHTWDHHLTLKNSQPVENKDLMMGSGDQTVELNPTRQPVTRAVLAADFTARRIGYAEARCAKVGSAAARTETDTSSLGTTVGGAAQPTVQCGMKWVSTAVE